MIDAENEIFSAVRGAVITEYPGIYMVGEYVDTPPQFPCISLVEIDNAVYRNSSTNTVEENHAAVSYEVNIYSNKPKGKKSECKAIAAVLDGKMANLGFTRMMLQPVPNLADTTIYRMVGRYRAVIGKDHTIYRR
jgi:hypothetical protein